MCYDKNKNTGSHTAGGRTDDGKMDSLYEKYRKLNIAGALIALERRGDVAPYFCYPQNARAIGYEGCILYCFIEGFGDMVFAANPESCADRNVYPLAASFADFMRLVLACGSANPVEQIVWMDQKQFERHLREEEKARTDEQRELLAYLKRELDLTPMQDPFTYVKKLQAGFDGSAIQYDEEYYDVLGLERPARRKRRKEENGFEFPPVVFKTTKKKK